jgi:hypothetical protein
MSYKSKVKIQKRKTPKTLQRRKVNQHTQKFDEYIALTHALQRVDDKSISQMGWLEVLFKTENFTIMNLTYQNGITCGNYNLIPILMQLGLGSMVDYPF